MKRENENAEIYRMLFTLVQETPMQTTAFYSKKTTFSINKVSAFFRELKRRGWVDFTLVDNPNKKGNPIISCWFVPGEGEKKKDHKFTKIGETEEDAFTKIGETEEDAEYLRFWSVPRAERLRRKEEAAMDANQSPIPSYSQYFEAHRDRA